MNSSNRESREQIFRDIRRALDGGLAPVDPLGSRPARHLAQLKSHLKPVLTDAGRQRFIDELAAVHASTDTIRRLEQVPAAVAKYLHRQGLPPTFLRSDTSLLKKIQWPGEMDVRTGQAGPEDHTAVTGALLGIVETGTLVLCTGKDTPASHYFMPEDHIVVLPETQLVRHLEDAWPAVRRLDPYPRGVFMVTGPSKTADVEQTLQYGAHGPRRLHIILVASAE